MASPSSMRRNYQRKRNYHLHLACAVLIIVCCAAFLARLLIPFAPAAAYNRPIKLHLRNRTIQYNDTLPPMSPLRPISYPLWWFAPFFSNSGMGTEATTFIFSLYRENGVAKDKMWITHDGDIYDESVVKGLPAADAELLTALKKPLTRQDRAIAVCHTFAGHWTTYTSLCTNTSLVNHAYRIGRTMFESDRVPPVFVSTSNLMDEIWVPSHFSLEIYATAGVARNKIRVIGEPVNTTFFDPSKYNPIPLPVGQLTLGSPRDSSCGSQRFVFLSVFKFEPRKGWDVLLRSYLTEFNPLDCVELYIITRPAMIADPNGKVPTLQQVCSSISRALELKYNIHKEDMPPVYLITDFIAGRDLPRYYRAADAFVLPSRGEGWGLPIVEAMSMALPVIATNWSGMTEYLTPEVGYPLEVSKLVASDGGWWFINHRWAQPSTRHLKELMRRVLNEPQEAAEKGIRARQLMVTKYSPPVMARTVHRELERIDKMLQQRDKAAKQALASAARQAEGSVQRGPS